MIHPIPKPSGKNTLCLLRAGETPTLDDAINLLNADRYLSPVRRRDLVSALRRVAAACDMLPCQMFAEAEWLRQKLAAQSAFRLGRSSKTRSNILSNALAALAHVGMALRRPQVARSPHWQGLWEHLNPSAKIALGSFTRFCSFHQILPTEVTDEVVAAYREIASSLRKKAEEAIYDLTVQWNRAADLIPGWPKQRLSVPRRRQLISPPMDALPAAFRNDLERYMAWLQRGDLLAVDAAPPLAAATIKHRQLQLRRFFGELVASGIAPAEIQDLRTLVRPDLAYRGLQAMLGRKGGPSGMIHGMAYTLLVIAKHYARLPDDDLQRLRTACARLKPNRRGMTAKNRARLRQFDDPQNLNRLLALPERLLREARTKTSPPRRAAEFVEVALAIELLLMTALRVKNLAAIHLDENIQWSRSSKRGVCHLTIEGRHVKNGQDRDYELEGETVALLKGFLDRYRAILAPASCRWLFARRDGVGPVHPIVLATRISRTIRKRTGLTVNAHLFRALAAKIYLDRHPGGYEVVRRGLGHVHLSTTTEAYTGMENISATKQFDRVIRARQELAKNRGASNRSSTRADR